MSIARLLAACVAALCAWPSAPLQAGLRPFAARSSSPSLEARLLAVEARPVSLETTSMSPEAPAAPLEARSGPVKGRTAALEDGRASREPRVASLDVHLAALNARTRTFGTQAAAFQAQEGGAVRGTVVAAETGAPLEGAQVRLEGLTAITQTGADGEFLLDGVPAGRHTLYVKLIGRRTLTRAVEVRAGASTTLSLELAPAALGLARMVVTATGEARRLAATSATVGVLEVDRIDRSHASHPSDVMGQIPGVWVNTTGGEGHMTAIRQPLTTNPVYLYLEDGVPTRSTGFFNHNALYEINVPQAGRIEVLKGPSSSLYGSDAIGGVVNVSTRPASSDPGLDVSVEGGRFGWARLLTSAAFTTAGAGLRADLNLTRTDGWRDGTAYDRQSATVRWDQELDDASSLATVLAVSRIDQNTAGSSRLGADDYGERPTLNYAPISYRKVRAARLSVE